MKNFKKFIISFIMLVSIFSLSPITANAEWRQSNGGWWYSNGSSWYTGWQYIDGNWYYFYSDGYMARDCYIGDYCVNSNGAWTTSVPTSNTTSSSSYSNGSTNNQSQTVYVSNNGIYHSSPHAHGMKSSTAMSLSEAQAKGYKACEKCY